MAEAYVGFEASHTSYTFFVAGREFLKILLSMTNISSI